MRPARSPASRSRIRGCRGDLHVPDPRRAVQHFIALTMRLALDVIDENPDLNAGELHALIADGVDAFLRAYV
nr:TetR/AcrR family transcriptional regulator C-terminal domain-containing protein [Saccharopolyspora aridisoli]